MSNDPNPTETNVHDTKLSLNTPSQPGDGWGLIGADGSDEGYGVVGLTNGNDDLSPFEVSIIRSPPSPDRMRLKSSEMTLTSEISASSILSNNTTTTALTATTTTAVVNNTNAQATTNIQQPQAAVAPVVDMNGDIRLVEEAIQQGRRIDTGPCHTGTRRMSHGPPSFSAKVILVTASGHFCGVLSLAPKDVYFLSSFDRVDENNIDSAAVNVVRQLRIRRRRWTISSISAIYLRRYRLRETAIEVFFRRGKHRHFFVDFGPTKEDAKARTNFARALMEAAPTSAFKQWPLMSPFRLVNEHKVQEKWIRGEINNFEYLMALNTISGRSFNDLCQYPVMPWIIADYTSSSIDLNDPNIYRDLSKPMGAINETRLQEFLERYTSFSENETIRDIPPFMYGSHYSTMVGVVLHFLIRLQPFASLHKEMQNGRFDVADRLFSSIPMTYLHNTTQLSEVKELTPEWFTAPEMFRNVNNFDFGRTQDGSDVSDVELPPWASSPEDFVLINRQALESEYVSTHLHEWIDLIFGYKQIGPAAVEAHNVFYYLTYAGSVDRQMIKDEELRKAIELQIAHFGQVPQQLFRSPHPARQVIPKTSSPRPLKKCFVNSMITGTSTTSTSGIGSTTNTTTSTSAMIPITNTATTITPIPSSTPSMSSSPVRQPNIPPPPTTLSMSSHDVLTSSSSSALLVPTTSGSSSARLNNNNNTTTTNNNNNIMMVQGNEQTSLVGFVPFQNDEEELSATSKCAMVTRRNPALTRKFTLTSSASSSSSVTSDNNLPFTSPTRPQRYNPTGGKSNLIGPGGSISVGNIISFSICTERVVVVVDSGVVEVYK